MHLRVSIQTLLVLAMLVCLILVFRDRISDLVLRNLLMSSILAFACGVLFARRFRCRGLLIPLLLAVPTILTAVYSFLAGNLIMNPEGYVWTRQVPGLFSITDSVVDFICTAVYSSPESGGLMAALLTFAAVAVFASFTLGGFAGMVLPPKIVG